MTTLQRWEDAVEIFPYHRHTARCFTLSLSVVEKISLELLISPRGVWNLITRVIYRSFGVFRASNATAGVRSASYLLSASREEFDIPRERLRRVLR